MIHFRLVCACLLLSALSGCATIAKDSKQAIRLETFSRDNKPVVARCTAKNDFGEWIVYTPGSIAVHRSSVDLRITCEREKNDAEAGLGRLISRSDKDIADWIVGGTVGAIVDHESGAAYTYPSWMTIVMGDRLTYDRRDEIMNHPLPGKHTPEPIAKNTAQAGAFTPSKLGQAD